MPLHTSAQRNAVGVARLLIDRGAGVDAKAKAGMTPLHIAAGNDAHEMVQLLIERGAYVWARSDRGLVPVDYAISKNAGNAAMLLVNKVFEGRPIPRYNRVSGGLSLSRYARITLLHLAAWNNEHELVKLLLEFGADVNAKNIRGWMPLHIAVQENAAEAARLLIEHGASVNAKDEDGLTPLHGAAGQNAVGVAQLLVARGADVNAKSKNGRMPLHTAVLENAAEAARLLIEHGASVNAKDENGLTPLHDAAGKNAVDVAQLLIAHGADVNATSKNGQTPLHTAAWERATEAAQLLMAHGVDVNATNKNGWTPLHTAARGNASEAARLLIARGVDVNATSKSGQTPLFIADVYGPTVSTLLQRHGGRTSARADHDETLEQFVAKIGKALCSSYSRNNFIRLQKILKKSSQRLLGREVKLEEIYRYLQCDESRIGRVDLLRVTVANTLGTDKAAQELLHYFDKTAQAKGLLGTIVSCKRWIGEHQCLNVFEHLERDIYLATRRQRPYRLEALKDFKSLLQYRVKGVHLEHDPRFCQKFLKEPRSCPNTD